MDMWRINMEIKTKMNKMLGFYELPKTGLPCIAWKKFDYDMKLDDTLLWTVRTAVLKGNDLSLPRKVGVSATEAYEFGKQQLNHLKDRGLVVIYPYFIAEKSGTLEVKNNRTIIEAVKKDLWNLVTKNQKDVTIIVTEDGKTYDGDHKFLDTNELEDLLHEAEKLRSKYRDSIAQGNSLLLEWSFAFNTNKNGEKIGRKYLVFYEVREL